MRAIPVIRGLLLCALLLGALATARAATNTVVNLNDSGPGSLRQAIADAAPGDTIDYAVTGTITLTSGELVITNDLTISGPGATNLTVSGNNASRVLLITNGVVNISDLTVANGRMPSAFGPASIANLGAGIYNSTTLTISNCYVIANTNAVYYGGGVVNWRGALTVINSEVSRNSGAYAGILDFAGTTVAKNSLIRFNSGTALGTQYGAIHVVNSAVLENDGDGILNEWGFQTLTNTTISGNAGGGLSSWAGTTNFIFCSTVCSNSTGVYIGHGGGEVTIASSVLAHNASDIYVSYNYRFVSQDFNLIGNTNGATITGVTTHNIYGKDPLLGPLADNGGPTMTHALLPGSPAIDHGSSGGLATDQRGLPRPFNFPAYYDADDASDIGAVEMQEGPQPGPVFTVNSNDDADDGVPGIAHCSLREATAAANANADTNTIDFAAEVPGVMAGVTGTITLTNGELAVTNSVNINGPGSASLAVSGNNTARVFSFNNATAAVSDLTIMNGAADAGTGIRNNGGSLTISGCLVTSNYSGGIWGGGIFNSGVLTIRNSTVSHNDTPASTGSAGGGIYNMPAGTLIALQTSILFNKAAVGGGIYSAGLLSITNCTISGNRASYGGGIYSAGPGAICSSTICANDSSFPAGGIVIHAGQMEITDSIVARNTIYSGQVADVEGTLDSLDYNLIQNTNGCTITNLTAHNIYNQDPKLGPLADLGGPTPTHALSFDSPALDAGHSGGLTTDQRGLPRPIDDPNTPNAEGGDGSDIGAYEADPNLRITGLAKTGGDVWLSFNSMFGKTYRVETTDELPPTTWNVLTNDVPGTGGRFQALDAGAASLPQRYYRTVQLQ